MGWSHVISVNFYPIKKIFELHTILAMCSQLKKKFSLIQFVSFNLLIGSTVIFNYHDRSIRHNHYLIERQ